MCTGYIVTQPALDDVPEGFYPSEETMDEVSQSTTFQGLREVANQTNRITSTRIDSARSMPHPAYRSAGNKALGTDLTT